MGIVSCDLVLVGELLVSLMVQCWSAGCSSCCDESLRVLDLRPTHHAFHFILHLVLLLRMKLNVTERRQALCTKYVTTANVNKHALDQKWRKGRMPFFRFFRIQIWKNWEWSAFFGQLGVNFVINTPGIIFPRSEQKWMLEDMNRTSSTPNLASPTSHRLLKNESRQPGKWKQEQLSLTTIRRLSDNSLLSSSDSDNLLNPKQWYIATNRSSRSYNNWKVEKDFQNFTSPPLTLPGRTLSIDQKFRNVDLVESCQYRNF